MTTTSTSYGFRHPWFNTPSTKRKQSSSPPSSDEDDYGSAAAATTSYGGITGRSLSPYRTPYVGPESTARPVKRRRCSALERGFAHLTINRPINTNVHSRIHTSPYPSPATSCPSSNPSIVELDMLPTRTPSPAPMDADYPSYSVLHPTSIEEPTSPVAQCAPLPLPTDNSSDDIINDVKMKSQSWYEPEKDRKYLNLILARLWILMTITCGIGIVIVDLDDSDEEDSCDDPKTPSDGAEITISSALLDHIRTQQSRSVPLTNISTPSTALVVFRPPLIQNSKDNADRKPKKQEMAVSPPSPPRDDDAMDIEP